MLLKKLKKIIGEMKNNTDSYEYYITNIPTEVVEKSQEEWKEELEALKPAVRKKLTEVYGMVFHDWWIDAQCKNILDDMPGELYQNVWEWIRDEPISVIRIGELSIKQIIDYTKHDFLDCAELMCRYTKRGCTYARGILNYYFLM